MNNFNLTKLIKEYFDLLKGYLIDNPNTLNFICKIFDICDIYISNKALKHIVESRRDKDFMNVEEIINVVKVFEIILLDPDVVFINQNRLNSIGVCKNLNSADSLGIMPRIQRLINIKHLIK